MFTVYRTLLLLIHFFCDLYTAVHNYCVILYRKCSEIWYGENLKTEVEWLVRAVSRTKNLPKHIVVVFGAKEDTVLDCVRIIGWCVTLGIPYISFYDISGFLIRNESFLKHEVAKRRPDLWEHIAWSKPNTMTKQNGMNGCTLKVRVSLLSPLDGKGEIIALTRKLAEAVIAGTIRSDEIDTDLLNKKLNSRGIPDPDLGLVYSNVCSTYGVLPWQTRVTEFFTLPLCFRLSARDFAHLLVKYSKCEQRYGK